MNLLSVIVVGLNEWERYTAPCLASLRQHEPMAFAVCADNGSDPAYPFTVGVHTVRSCVPQSYAAGINMGIKAAPLSAWYLVLNNDVLVEKSFRACLDGLDTNNLYGFKLYHGVLHPKVKYLSGWALLISYRLLDAVGLFDTAYAPMWFEDADYSHRALKAGFGLVELDRSVWGLRHLEDERETERKQILRTNIEARHANRAYFLRKHGF